MTLTIQVPDDLVSRVRRWKGLAIECYRSGTLTPRQCRELLGVSRMEFEGILKNNGVEEGAYDVADLERDLKLVETFRESQSGVA